MKKATAWFFLAVMVLTAAGCAKKTASEQLQDDMEKAGKEMQKAGNEMKKDIDSWGK